MSEIMQKNTLDNMNGSLRYSHSLNKGHRQRQLKKITDENQVTNKNKQYNENQRPARTLPPPPPPSHSPSVCCIPPRQAILRRIQAREPVYNHYQWEEERMQNEKYLRNIMEYPGGAGDSTLPAETRMMMTTAMATGILDGTPQSPHHGMLCLPCALNSSSHVCHYHHHHQHDGEQTAPDCRPWMTSTGWTLRIG